MAPRVFAAVMGGCCKGWLSVGLNLSLEAGHPLESGNGECALDVAESIELTMVLWTVAV